MKPYEKSTLWVSAIIGIIVILLILAGWRERGFIAFDAGFIILILSPIIITAWYYDAKEEYRYRKGWKR